MVVNDDAFDWKYIEFSEPNIHGIYRWRGLSENGFPREVEILVDGKWVFCADLFIKICISKYKINGIIKIGV
jgi:hypothetical protein